MPSMKESLNHSPVLACRLLAECGHENHWYMRQCAMCDASNGDLELKSRVAAILQVSMPGCTTCSTAYTPVIASCNIHFASLSEVHLL